MVLTMIRRKICIVSTASIVIIILSFYLGVMTSSKYRVEPEFLTSQIGIARKEDQTGTSLAIQEEKMVVFSAQISLEVEDMTVSANDIALLAEKLSGYVASTQISISDSRSMSYVTIRIPKSRFHEALSRLYTLGKLLDQRTLSDDVTERYIDLRTRLDNLQRQENRLQEILSKTITVTEILAVEKEIERVRGNIESLQGQINYLDRNIEMSIVRVQLVKAVHWLISPGMDWKEVLETAIRSFFFVVRGGVILAVSVSPLAATISIVLMIHRKWKQNGAAKTK